MSNGIERLSIEPVEDQPRQHYNRHQPPPPPPQMLEQPQQSFASVTQDALQRRHAHVRAQVLAMLQAVAMIVSARLLLLLAVACGFVLAWQATQSQTIPAIAVLVAWSVLTVLPLVLLDHTARIPPNPYQPGR